MNNIHKTRINTPAFLDTLVFLDDKTLPDRLYSLLEIDPRYRSSIIAGGSVANALLHLYTGCPFVLNDIDIFNVQRTNHIAVASREDGFTNDVRQVHNKQGDYPTTFTNGDTTFYMTDREQNDRYDFVHYMYESNIDRLGSPFDTCRIIINNFDLNACQAALVDGRLIYTDQFVYFLTTLQIEMVNFHTIKTLVRGVVKAEQLGCYFDLDRAYEFVLIYFTAAIEQFTISFNATPSPENMFIQSLTNCVLDDPRKQTVLNEIKRRYDWSILDKLYKVHSMPDAYNTLPQLTKYTHLYYSFCVVLQPSEPRHVLGVLYQMAYLKDYQKAILAQLSINTRIYACMYDEMVHYLQGDIPQSLISDWNELLYEHSELKKCFNGLTLSQQLRLYQEIVKIVNIHGDLVYGLLESGSGMVDGCTVTPEFWKRLTDYEKVQYEPLVSVKLPIIKATTAVIVELTTAHDLRQEGKTMHHCVGGYDYAIKHGDSRIISIRDKDGKERSTAELRLKKHNLNPRRKDKNNDNKTAVVVAQHRGLQNCNPSERHTKIVNTFVKILNDGGNPEKYFVKQTQEYTNYTLDFFQELF